MHLVAKETHVNTHTRIRSEQQPDIMEQASTRYELLMYKWIARAYKHEAKLPRD